VNELEVVYCPTICVIAWANNLATRHVKTYGLALRTQVGDEGVQSCVLVVPVVEDVSTGLSIRVGLLVVGVVPFRIPLSFLLVLLEYVLVVVSIDELAPHTH